MSASSSQKIVLGSRGSELARTQTGMVEAALRRVWPSLKIDVQIISTRGDVRTAEPLDPRAGRKGLFTGEIERALAADEIDVAVHSAKDLPSEMTAGLELGAVLPRAPVEDVLVSKTTGRGPIATGSVRRRHQFRWKFPDVEVVDLRGNVPTRLRKLIENDWRGVVLARAGLERLGYDVVRGSFEFEGATLRTETFSAPDFLPAGGQGIIALQIRSDDQSARAVVAAINHAATCFCLQAEREFLRLLQGDCGSPVGVLATIDGSTMTIRAQVFEPPRVEPRAARVEGDASAPEKLARELWEAING
ncbi:MAG TPA: hydroxymethylbilane synthase [Chthoniobacterales bacterium]|nr:hydroxymethylbilane synthase [Chthoniobacterales bacterium]